MLNKDIKCLCGTILSGKKNLNKINYSYSFRLKKHSKRIKYYKCEDCNLYFQELLLKPAKVINDFLSELYDKKYFHDNYNFNNQHLKKREIQYNLDLMHILNFFEDKKEKSILDYGCGNGNFLKKFKGKKFGFEINKDIKKSKRIEYLSFDQIRKKKFDMIVMRGVIEHIPDFYIVLNNLFKTIKNKGLFYLTATPNSLSLAFEMNKRKFNQNCLEHIYHFNHLNLSKFFLLNGFSLIDTSFQYFKTPYKNITKDYENIKNHKNLDILPTYPGNMMTLIFKKIN